MLYVINIGTYIDLFTHPMNMQKYLYNSSLKNKSNNSYSIKLKPASPTSMKEAAPANRLNSTFYRIRRRYQAITSKRLPGLCLCLEQPVILRIASLI